MQIIHTFGITPLTYYRRGKENDFPQISHCPCCGYPYGMERHGFYWRNALFFRWEFRIPICRFRCTSCGKTVSVLPDFLLPYYQFGLLYVIEALRSYFVSPRRKIYYQLMQFYRKRFLKNLNRIMAFFRDSGYRGIIPEKERAIKLLEMIRCAFPKAATFAKRFQRHFTHNFMAN